MCAFDDATPRERPLNCIVAVSAVQFEENVDSGQSPEAFAALPRTLAEIYQDYAPSVFRNLRRLGVVESQIEDAVQDVFVIAHRRLPEFEGRSTLKTWILGIALRVAKDYRRSETRFAKRLGHLATLILSDAALQSSPSDAVEQKEAGQLLHHLLSSLPDESREMLVLVELEGLSVREACDVLTIRPRTGQRRLRAGMDAISAALSRTLAEDRRQS